jgi:hypothetical protein
MVTKHDGARYVIFDDQFDALEMRGLEVVGHSVLVDVHADDIVFVGAQYQ